MLFINTGEELRLTVNSQDYLSKLVEYGIMKLHAAAIVKETNQSWIEEDDFQVIMPIIEIKVDFQSFCKFQRHHISQQSSLFCIL